MRCWCISFLKVISRRVYERRIFQQWNFFALYFESAGRRRMKICFVISFILIRSSIIWSDCGQNRVRDSLVCDVYLFSKSSFHFSFGSDFHPTQKNYFDQFLFRSNGHFYMCTTQQFFLIEFIVAITPCIFFSLKNLYLNVHSQTSPVEPLRNTHTCCV